MKTVGERIRVERQQRKMTLADVSAGTGLSKSYLSQLERGLSQASVASIKKIARHFEIGVVKFFEDSLEDNHKVWGYKQPSSENGAVNRTYARDISVIRAQRRKGITLPGSHKVVYEILTPDLNRQLEVMYLRISKGDNSGDETMIDPPGEKFGLVLKGAIEVILEGDVYNLETGDSICFPSDIRHSWRGTEGDSIEVIWVLTPPSF